MDVVTISSTWQQQGPSSSRPPPPPLPPPNSLAPFPLSHIASLLLYNYNHDAVLIPRYPKLYHLYKTNTKNIVLSCLYVYWSHDLVLQLLSPRLCLRARSVKDGSRVPAEAPSSLSNPSASFGSLQGKASPLSWKRCRCQRTRITENGYQVAHTTPF